MTTDTAANGKSRQISITNPLTLSGLLNVLVSQYGTIAFGLVALLILWKVIVAPELEASRKSAETYAAAAESLKQASVSMEATARVMERVVNKLED